VRPEDALGALLRGDQVAVLGDTRQLPPTSFFDSVVDAEEEEDVASVADVESILHQCKRSFQTKTLRWHYRSRHESLIAVSNQEFYDNNLYIYPSSIHEDAYLGLHFNHLSDTVYDRGKSGGNRLEAKAVAQAALEHYRRSPQKSLGVGAFNTKQQQMILEEVEYILRQHPNMQEAFSSARDEHFFVKNLETIQGDERDVILISVGFGFDGDRRFSRNFGPLNQEGGERRLNVLITRAREANVVFSNFTSAHLQVDAGSPFGLRSLKVFLEYAQHRNLRSIVETGGDFDSPFEESVYEYLRSNGHEVHKQVGCASYRVDLAIVDPQLPGHYLLGVECDGARYHSSPVARDRDRLREQVLRNLGWQLYRIWSTDWYRNRSDTKARLLDAVKKAKCDSQARATTRTAPVLQMVREQTIELADDHDLIPEHIDISSSVVTYERYSPKSFARRGDLLETPVREVAAVVKRVVHTESPIALDEAVQRIRHLWKLGRAGSRIRDAIGDAVDLAESTGDIRRDEAGFLWFSNSSGDIKVRRRGAGDPRDIDTICNEEIAEALRLVLKAQHATVPEDLVRQAARLFGFKAVGRVVEERIESVIERLEQQNEIKRQTNGMIDFCDTR
jgi:very-short-patch-repair endonuclease